MRALTIGRSFASPFKVRIFEPWQSDGHFLVGQIGRSLELKNSTRIWNWAFWRKITWFTFWLNVNEPKITGITVLILNINNLVKLWPNDVNYDLQIICVIINLEGNDRFGIKNWNSDSKIWNVLKIFEFSIKISCQKWIFWWAENKNFTLDWEKI